MKCQSFTLRLDDRQPLDLARLNEFLGQITPVQVQSALVSGPRPAWSVLVLFEGETPPLAAEEEPLATPQEVALFEALRRWRSQKAKEEGVKPYVIAHNAELSEMVTHKPATPEALAAIKGFGPRKVERYGQELLELLRQAPA